MIYIRLHVARSNTFTGDNVWSYIYASMQLGRTLLQGKMFGDIYASMQLGRTLLQGTMFGDIYTPPCSSVEHFYKGQCLVIYIRLHAARSNTFTGDNVW